MKLFVVVGNYNDKIVAHYLSKDKAKEKAVELNERKSNFMGFGGSDDYYIVKEIEIVE